MGKLLISTGAPLIVIVVLLLAVSQTGYSQNASSFGQLNRCRPFQQVVAFDLTAGDTLFTGTIALASGTTVTIEQIALRIDATTSVVVPTVAALTTRVGSVTAAYYVSIPVDLWYVAPQRPLALMQAASLHADGGT